MARKDDGGAAFPRPASEDRKHGDQPDGNTTIHEQAGMSLRDYFAAHAPPMPDEWAMYRRTDPEHENEKDAEELELRAQWAFAWADLMLKARKAP